jgi:hypothetical protein
LKRPAQHCLLIDLEEIRDLQCGQIQWLASLRFLLEVDSCAREQVGVLTVLHQLATTSAKAL